jgi:hypothetical protein
MERRRAPDGSARSRSASTPQLHHEKQTHDGIARVSLALGQACAPQLFASHQIS